jgi:adenine-specific DNA-methyltransferase
LNKIEEQQNLYSASKDKEYRKLNGQFFTPSWVAKPMAKWLLTCGPKHIVDPACGFGTLLESCRFLGYKGNLKGIELDSKIAALAQDLSPTFDIINTDFLSLPFIDDSSFIVNPPYNRFQNHNIPWKVKVFLESVVGQQLSGYTNQYAIFLYLIVSKLPIGQRAAFIIPSEFLATGYGRQVKDFLIKSKRLSHLIIFDDAVRVFPDASTTAAVLLFDENICNTLNVAHISKNSEELLDSICSGNLDKSIVQFDYASLNPDSNWQNLGTAKVIQNNFVQLSTFAKVSRGIATGANEFFLLSHHEIKENKLENNFIRCIASSFHIKKPIFTEDDWISLKSKGEKCFLFDGLSSNNKHSDEYIAEGMSALYHERFLTKSRNPWFKIENKKPAEILVAVFGRDQFKVILNTTNVVNLTAFHGLYLKNGFDKFALFIWLFFQSSLGIVSVKNSQRSYGDGLKKLEPGDWNKVQIPDFRILNDADFITINEICNNATLKCHESNNSDFQSLIARFEDLIVEKIIQVNTSFASEENINLHFDF